MISCRLIAGLTQQIQNPTDEKWLCKCKSDQTQAGKYDEQELAAKCA